MIFLRHLLRIIKRAGKNKSIRGRNLECRSLFWKCNDINEGLKRFERMVTDRITEQAIKYKPKKEKKLGAPVEKMGEATSLSGLTNSYYV